MERFKALIAATRTFFRDVLGELNKVVWPTWNRTAKLTGVVVGIVLLIMAYLYALDWPLGFVFTKLVQS